MFKVNNKDNVNDVILVSLLLTLDIFQTFSTTLFLLLTLNRQMFAGAILDLSSGNYDIAFFAFLWHIINTLFNVISNCNLRNCRRS